MTTLPTDSDERKNIPMAAGVLAYFPAALAGVARVSKAGNDKHNPGQRLHWARGKSSDHADCIIRHLMDVQGLIAELSHYVFTAAGEKEIRDQLMLEASQLAWRALALSQQIHEYWGNAPLAPGAKLPE